MVLNKIQHIGGYMESKQWLFLCKFLVILNWILCENIS